MKKAVLARQLGISRQMVYRLEQRGMPTTNVQAARVWRSKNLEPAMTKKHRIDGNTGTRYAPRPKPAEPRRDSRTIGSATRRLGVDEANMYTRAALFTLKFGVERFGPLLVHLGCVMTEDGHDVRQVALDRTGVDFPPFGDNAWQDISDEYFRLLPIGQPDPDDLRFDGY